MEAKFASILSEEHELIAHLQSMLWSNSDADVNLPSPDTSTDSCLTTSTMPSSLPHIESECYSTISLVNNAVDWCLVPQSQTISANTSAVASNKRMLPMDEQINRSKNTTKKPCTIGQVSRNLSSNNLDDEANTQLANQNSSWCYSTEDDSNRMCDGPITPKQSGISRGRSGSSKNSQSLYTKKRRERINEKLRLLQQLISNGTKVDISTMLEEAVQYVKFLQLQIKLLSCDETWMYAPLAYNGVSINLGSTANES